MQFPSSFLPLISAWWSLEMLQVWPSSSSVVCSISWLPTASSPSSSRAILKVLCGTYLLCWPFSYLCMDSQCKNVIRISDGSFLRTLATSLMDFSELSSIAALSQLLEVCWQSALLVVLVLLALSGILDHSSSFIKSSNLHHQKQREFLLCPP